MFPKKESSKKNENVGKGGVESEQVGKKAPAKKGGKEGDSVRAILDLFLLFLV